jgi:transporter family protein
MEQERADHDAHGSRTGVTECRSLGLLVVFALSSGICGAIGLLLFTEAIKLGKAAVIVTLTATYPTFTVLLSLVVLRETLSVVNVIGVLLVTVGVILVAR